MRTSRAGRLTAGVCADVMDFSGVAGRGTYPVLCIMGGNFDNRGAKQRGLSHRLGKIRESA